MAELESRMKWNYPLPVYNFRVTVDGVAMSFSQISGLAIEYDSVSYRHGLSFWEGEDIATFYYDGFVSLTLERGLILASEPLILFDWLESGHLRSLEISLCDESGSALLSWRIAQAVPIKLQAPSFDAAGQDVAIESVELKARGISMMKN